MNIYFQVDENNFKVGQLFSTNEDISLVRLYHGSNPISGFGGEEIQIKEKVLGKAFIISKTLFDSNGPWPKNVFCTSHSNISKDDNHPFIVSTILLRRTFISSFKKSKEEAKTCIFFTKQMWDSLFYDMVQEKKTTRKQNGFLYFRFKQKPQENIHLKRFFETILQLYGQKSWEDAEKETLKAGHFYLVPIGKYSQYISIRKKILKLIDQSVLNDFVKFYYYCPTSRRDEVHKIDFEGNNQIEKLNALIGDISSYRSRKALFLIEDRRNYDSYHYPEKCKVSFIFNPIEMKLKIEFKYFVRSHYY